MDIVVFARIFCNLSHTFKNLQKYTELHHTENYKDGNKLENIFASSICKSCGLPENLH